MAPKFTQIRNYRVYRKILPEAWVFPYRGHEIVVHFPVVKFRGRPVRGWQFSKDGIPLTQIDRPQREEAVAEFIQLADTWTQAQFSNELATTIKGNIRK